MRPSQLIGSVEVGTLDILEKADVVRRRLAKHSKKLDESAFNNQVPQRPQFCLINSTRRYCGPLSLLVRWFCYVFRDFLETTSLICIKLGACIEHLC